MAYPGKYDRNFSFTDDEIERPSAKTPGDKLDLEFDSLKQVTDAIIDASKLIQRADGALQNGIVGRAQLSAGLQVGVDPARAWVTGNAYEVAAAVTYSNGLYTCLVAHTSGTFAADLAAGKWELLASYSTAAVAPGSIGSTELATGAVTEGKLGGSSVSSAKIQSNAVVTAKIADGAVTTAKIASRGVAFGKLPETASSRLLGRVSAGAGDLEPIPLGDGLKFSGGALTLDYATLAEAQAQTGHNATHVMTPYLVWQMILSIMPVGTPLYWPAATPPDGWWACDGSVKDRAGAGAALFAVIGTTYNTGGETSSQFRLPNEEGTVRRGWISGGARDPGRVLGSYQADDFKEHDHGAYGVGVTVLGAASGYRSASVSKSDVTSKTGGSETRMKNLSWLPIIRYR